MFLVCDFVLLCLLFEQSYHVYHYISDQQNLYQARRNQIEFWSSLPLYVTVSLFLAVTAIYKFVRHHIVHCSQTLLY